MKVSVILFLMTLFLALSSVRLSAQSLTGIHPDLSWKKVATGMPEEWYGSDEAKAVIENVLFCQHDIGGWAKNKPYHHPLSEEDKATIIKEKAGIGATIDNGATITELNFLARVYKETKDERIRASFLNGVDYLFQAQYPNGGWPQRIEPWAQGALKVSANGRFLQHENGIPFFWLGDISWLLFQRLNREEAKHYFADRSAKGFNVVQCIFYQSYNDVSAYGDSAFVNKELTRPLHTPGKDPNDPEQYDYWDHVEYMVDLAAQYGIYMAISPTWGQLVLRDKSMTTQKAEAFASHLARFLKDKPNIIWINGGSAKPEVNTDIWEVIGSTIKKTDPRHLITFHPFGRMQSSTIFHHSPWLDINMFTSGHRRYDQDDTPKKFGEDNWRYVREDLAKTPAKPTLDGEPSFESLPQGLHDPTQPYWKSSDIRRYAYWSVFAGACGHTYGQNSVRQVYKQGVNKPESGAKLSFNEALNDSGSFQMVHLKKLVLSRPFFERTGDQSAVAGDEGELYDRILVCKGKSYLMAYTYTGRDFTIQMGKISGKKVKAWWYNPRSGEVTYTGKYKNIGKVVFNPPFDKANGNDWVLVLDDASESFEKPGIYPL